MTLVAAPGTAGAAGGTAGDQVNHSDAAPAPSPAAAAWSGRQQALAALIALAILIDGFDSQLIGLTLPAIAADWGLEKRAFAGVLAIGTVGIAAGAMCAGIANDRFGRRPSLIASMAVVGLGGLSLAFTSGLFAFGIARFGMGVGIGAAVASATTGLAEFTPPHRRSLVISIGPLCMPVGGLVASSAAALLMPRLGWAVMFLIGGAAALLLTIALIPLLPETPAFLAARGERAAGGGAAGSRMQPASAGRGVRGLLAAGFRRDTILVWIAFFSCLLSAYLGISWIPSLFADAGGSLALSSVALAANGVGAIAGSIMCVALIQWLGTRVLLVGFGVAGALFLTALALLFQHQASVPLLFALIACSAMAIAVTQSALYVLVAQIYPSEMRGAGVGIGLAVARCGAVLSAFVGGWALQRGGFAFFLINAAAVCATAAAALGIRRHVGAARLTGSGA